MILKVLKGSIAHHIPDGLVCEILGELCKFLPLLYDPFIVYNPSNAVMAPVLYWHERSALKSVAVRRRLATTLELLKPDPNSNSVRLGVEPVYTNHFTQPHH